MTTAATTNNRSVEAVRRGVLVCLFALTASACDSGSRPAASSGEALAQPGFGLVLPSYEIQDPPAGATTIYLQARFLSAPHGHVAGSSADGAGRPLGAEELEGIELSIERGEVLVASSPSLAIAAGQRSHALEAHQAAYIGDFRLIETPNGELTVDPVVSVLTTGCVLDVRGRVDGDTADSADEPTIVLDLLEPQLVVKLGSRQCIAKLPQHGAEDPLPFEEPVLLRATASKTVSPSVPIRLRSGVSLLMPLDVAVQQHTAQARAYATEIEEEFRPATSPDGPRQFFLLLTARIERKAPPPERG